MLRKVESLDIGVPYKFIEEKEDGFIVNIEPSSIYNNSEDECIGEDDKVSENTLDVDPTAFGSLSSWDEVNNLFYFDLIIGNYKYSWNKKSGYKHICIKDGKLGLVKYTPIKCNGKIIGNTKRIEVLNDSLTVKNNYLTVNGACYQNTVFKDYSTNSTSIIGKIKKIAPDGNIYNIHCKECIEECLE